MKRVHAVARQSASYQLLRILKRVGTKLSTSQLTTGELSGMESKRSRGHLRSLRTFSTFFTFSQPHKIRSCAQPAYWNPSYRLSGWSNGSTQHFPEVYSQESENLKFVVGVDLSADPTGNSRLGLRSSGSIVVRARWCFVRAALPGALRITEVDFHIRGYCELFVFRHLQSITIVSGCFTP